MQMDLSEEVKDAIRAGTDVDANELFKELREMDAVKISISFVLYHRELKLKYSFN